MKKIGDIKCPVCGRGCIVTTNVSKNEISSQMYAEWTCANCGSEFNADFEIVGNRIVPGNARANVEGRSPGVDMEGERRPWEPDIQ